jgi:hypothetical protein
MRQSHRRIIDDRVALPRLSRRQPVQHYAIRAFLTGTMIDRGLATLHRTIFDPVLFHARTRSHTPRLTVVVVKDSTESLALTNGTNSSLRGRMID